MFRQGITLEGIRATYTEEKKAFDKHSLWAYFVGRRISFYFAWLFLKLGISANKVTVVAIIVGLISCILLALGNYTAIIAGASLANIWVLLDFTDGNIARYNKTSSSYGNFLDALSGNLMSYLLFIAAGAGAFRNPGFLCAGIDRGIFPIVGGATCAFYILFFIVLRDFEILQQGKTGKPMSEASASLFGNTLCRGLSANILGLFGFKMPLLLVLAIFNCLGIFVLFYAVAVIGAFAIEMFLVGKAIIQQNKSGNQNA